MVAEMAIFCAKAVLAKFKSALFAGRKKSIVAIYLQNATLNLNLKMYP